MSLPPVTAAPAPLRFHGLGCLSALGDGIDAHLDAAARHTRRLRPLAELLGDDHPLAGVLAGWIEPRERLCHRLWAPASIAAIEAARQALGEAGWSAAELAEAALVLASSRGTAAGWLDRWPGRRSFPVMAASNSMHAEPATAVGIEFGIRGPCHVLATGCSAGLDALGIAALLVAAGAAPRALVVAVDLPLAGPLLDAYARTGMLSMRGANDPFAPDADGMLPAEAAAAAALDPAPVAGAPLLLGHCANSEAWRPTGAMPDGTPLARLLESAASRFGRPDLLCPHASGTAALAAAEPASIRLAFAPPPPLLLLKPLTGHAVAASGLLESVMLAGFLRAGVMPDPLSGLTLPTGLAAGAGGPAPAGPVFKVASGLGGHNSVVALRRAE